MCGIAGFLGPFGQAAAEAMADALAHRGPDGSGIELYSEPRSGGMALAHRRLAIIDLEGGRQPLENAEGTAAIVFNGEIYNYRSLRLELADAGFRFRTASDTEVILNGWLAWGEGVLERLEGMFAFAIWDRAQRRLFLARDRFGIKPLYWVEPAPGTFAFASEIKSLLKLREAVTVNRTALYNYLLYGWNSAEETIFSGIRQLPPAHSVIVTPGAEVPRPARYWSLPEPSASRQVTPEALLEALDAAVSSHLVADVPVGLTLSGGLDSSAIVSSMTRLRTPESVCAFTVGYGLPDDEIPYARIASAHTGAQLQERIVGLEAFSANFSRCVWHLEEPLAHPMLQTTFQLSAFVRENLKVVLIGEGSDELFAGYPQYKLFTFPFSLAPRPLLRRTFLDVANLMPTARQLRKLLRSDMLDADLLEDAAGRYDSYFAGDQSEGALRYELEHELVHNQLARIDKLTMAHSIEARVPFLDRRFAELAAAAPFGQKVRDDQQKAILRQALAGRMPREIVHRPKSGKKGTQALLPAILGTVRRGPLAELVSREAIGRRGWFDPDAVHRYLAAADNGLLARHPIERRKRAKFCLALATLEQWARLFLDGQPT